MSHYPEMHRVNDLLSCRVRKIFPTIPLRLLRLRPRLCSAANLALRELKLYPAPKRGARVPIYYICDRGLKGNENVISHP